MNYSYSIEIQFANGNGHRTQDIKKIMKNLKLITGLLVLLLGCSEQTLIWAL
jgi:hypothetical protein